MNTMVRMTPITSQTMMVRMVLFTGDDSFEEKTRELLQRRFGRLGGLQPPCQEELLGALVPARIRLPDDHFPEGGAQRFEIFIIPCPLEDFYEEGALGLQV